MRSRTARGYSCLLPSLLVSILLSAAPSTALSLPRLFTRAALQFPSSSNSRDVSALPVGSSFAGEFVCRSTGECSPCPSNELGSPVCKVYGNRRALTCVSPHAASSSVGSSSSHESAPPTGNRSPPPPSSPEINAAADSPPKNSQLKDETAAGEAAPGWKPVLEDEETVEEALELDPDPEGLDDEELQDALRGDSGEEVEADQRKARRRTAALAGRSALGGEVGEGGDGYQQSLRLRTPAAEGLQRRQSQEIYTWEACARVVTKERADFFEFVLCNIFFATISVAVLVYRHRALASRQFGTLAARIGMQVS